MLGEDLEDPEEFLEELFQAWYRLLAVRTMATHSSATYGRMARQVRFLPDTAPPLFTDIADQFAVVTTMADGQREFLHGVIEFYQTRTSTHMTMAAEKSASTAIQQNEDMRRITAWVAIVAVPTAVTGFFGQNVPYPGFGETSGFVASMLIIVVFARFSTSSSNARMAVATALGRDRVDVGADPTSAPVGAENCVTASHQRLQQTKIRQPTSPRLGDCQFDSRCGDRCADRGDLLSRGGHPR